MDLNLPQEPRFRPIQPASTDKPGGLRSMPPFQSSIPKKRAVFRACYDCRKAKTKCDGIRPKCGPCLAKDRGCGYDTEEAPSSIPLGFADAAPPLAPTSGTRLQALEMLIDLLQKSSSEQAAHLLQRIRTADNPVAMLEALGDSSTPPPVPEGPDAQEHLKRWLRTQDPDDYSTFPGCSTSSGSVQSDPDATSSLNMTSASSFARRSGLGDDTLADSVAVFGDEDDEDGIDPRCPPLVAKPPVSSIQHTIPGASITEECLKTFFICSGRLFHVFPKERVTQLYQSVYNDHSSPSDASRIDLGCLMSIASVGAQYMCGSFGREIEEAFYEIGKHYLDITIQLRPLDAIRVCMLLAVYNVMSKATVSLAYVEIGLGLCRRFGLHSSSSHHPNFTEEAWVDNRKTWRTLMFLSSWLSTTLGYISGNEAYDDRLSLSDLQVEAPRCTSDVVQTEIAKICVLKANILRVHLAVDDITAPALQAIVQGLQDWYTDLPPEMRLDCTGREDLDLETKRSISHIHLHYLGASMLFYSRIASQFMQPLDRWRSMPVELRRILEQLASEATVAARTSSRVLWLLYEEHSIFKRCWLVIFQAYTSCLVLLHSSAQKQLHGSSAEDLMEDIGYIKDLLAILYFCGELDSVAASFHKQLTVIFENILARVNVMGNPGDAMDLMMDIVTPGDSASSLSEGRQDSAYLLTMPANADMSRVNLSMSLLSMLCRPFGHPSSVIIGPAEVNSSVEEVVPQTKSWSKWGLDRGHPYQWDIDTVLPHGTKAAGPPLSCGHWLGSVEPSGWVSSATSEGVR